MSRVLLLLLLSAALAGLSFLVHGPTSDARLDSEVERLQRAIDAAAGELEATAAHQVRELVDNGPQAWMSAQVLGLEAVRERTGVFMLGLAKDSLVCWSGQPPLRPSLLQGDTRAHLVTGSGVFLHASVKAGDVEMHCLRPVWITPPIENRALHRHFHGSWHTTQGLEAQAKGPVLRDRAGAVMLSVGWRSGASWNDPWITARLALLLISAVCFVAAMWILAARVARDRGPLAGSLLLTGSILAWRWALLATDVSGSFGHLPLFDPAVYAASFLFPSLGDLIINAALLLMLAAFLLHALRQRAGTDVFPALLAWSGALLFASWITHLFIGLVHDSSVDLDLHHAQGLGATSFMAMSGVALLLAAWTIFSLAVLRAFVSPMAPRAKWGTGIVALGISVLLHHMAGVVDTVLFLWPVPMLLLLAGATGRRSAFAQVLFGVAVLAAFSAHILTRATRQREHRERAVLAERLVSREDPVVESLFHEVAPALRADPATYRLLTGQVPCDAAALDRVVRQRFFGGYWERYDVRLFGFPAGGGAMCASDNDPPRSIDTDNDPYTPPLAVADMPDLFMEERSGQATFHHSRMAIMPNDSLPPALLVVELHPRPWGQNFGFPELLLSGEDPVGRRAERYVQARYQQGLLVDGSSALGLPLQWQRSLDAEGRAWFTHEGYEFLAAGDPEGAILLLGLPVSGPIALITTFGYLFALYCLLVATAFLLPVLWRPRSTAPPGIATKVRVALAVLVITGLALFGLGTRSLIARQYERNAQEALLQKARSVHAELQQRLHGEPVLNADHATYLEHLLGRLSNVFFTDISVYSVSGRVLASSRPQIFAAGLMGRRMDPVAFERIVLRGASVFVHQEAIGSAAFSTAYLPLRDRHGTVLAHIALPSFADQARQEEERSGVWVAVANLFVVLFALSVLVAVFISNWTTRPLDLLKRSLGAVDLQGENRPLPYRGHDEVGQLVEVYNRKVEELKVSAEKLARSERESAWKEMARQVAHEIKNPLTPMKLSVQHFQHTWDPAMPDARERLDRFSANLVEQIDVLSRIAGEFSHFAQMPPAHPATIDLAEVARTSVQLFAHTPGCSVKLHTSGSPLVHADREHLLRTFNNLIKNAQQAIPDGREGLVEVLIRTEGREAIAEVRDNGAGIPADAADHVFVPKFTTKSSGMGLGLPMVRRMVENAGGRVWFTTEEDVGTSFFVALPLRG